MRLLLKKMVKILSIATLASFASISFGSELPEVLKLNPNYNFKYHRYPEDVKPFINALMNGDPQAGIEIRYRLTLDVAINADREGKVNVDPLLELEGVSLENIFGEESVSTQDINQLARYIVFSMKRAKILEAEYKQTQQRDRSVRHGFVVNSFGFGGAPFSPFNLFHFMWSRMSFSSLPFFDMYMAMFPIFRLPMIPVSLMM